METLQSEVMNGTIEAPGRTLGSRSISLVSAFQERDANAAYKFNIARAKSQLDATYNSLSSLNDLVEAFKQTLMIATAGDISLTKVAASARSLLSSLPAILSGSAGGVNSLSGQSGTTATIADYYSPTNSAARQDFLSKFSQQFGGAPDTINAGGVDGGAISAFYDIYNAGYDNESDWSVMWTGGMIDATIIEIGRGERVALPSITSLTPLRALTAAAAFLTETGESNFSPDTGRTLAQKALVTVSAAQTSLTGYRAMVGDMQNKISSAENRQLKYDNALAISIEDLQGIDQNAAIVELTSLKSQLEVSYTMTSYLNDMLLTKYIR